VIVRPTPPPGWRPPSGEPTTGTGEANLFAAFIIFMGLAYVVWFAWASGHAGYDGWAALVIAPILVLITVPLLIRLAKRNGDQAVLRIFIAGLLLKLVGALARYQTDFVLYSGRADANTYVQVGSKVAKALASGDFSKLPPLTGSAGTQAVEFMTGIVFRVVGVTTIGASLIFAWLGFWGMYFFYRAFKVAFPEGMHRRYARIVFLLPTMLFWTSAIGKDAWILFTLGMGAYGAARLMERKRGAYIVLLLGFAGMSLVRVHIALALFVAVFIAFVMRRSGPDPTLGLIGKVVGSAVLLVVGIALASHFRSSLGVENVASGGITDAMNQAAHSSTYGGSEFNAKPIRSPVDIPGAVLGVMFRPFPFEATNSTALAASLESSVVFGCLILAWRRFGAYARWARKRPYLVVAAAYSVIFIYAFSSVGNLGLLARQRAQVLPMALMVLAVPFTEKVTRSRGFGRP
jgi:hypothetical protein